MAFMMPVVKNDWDIYKSNRSRRSSECSTHRGGDRSRKVSECKSDCPSLSTSPGSDFLHSPAHRSVPVNMGQRAMSRTSSRTSQNSLQSPSKSIGNSPPKSQSSGSLNKFHTRLVDRLKRSLTKSDSTSNVGNSRSTSWGGAQDGPRSSPRPVRVEGASWSPAPASRVHGRRPRSYSGHWWITTWPGEPQFSGDLYNFWKHCCGAMLRASLA